MTRRQLLRLYWPAWNRAARAQGWRLVRGRLAAPPRTLWGGPVTTSLLAEIWRLAELRARASHRAPTPDDLRHATHIAALGYDRSSRELLDLELDRVLAAFRLLADPDDLEAMIQWQDRRAGERRRREWWLRHRIPPHYLREIMKDVYGHADLSRLDHDELGRLYATLRHRPGARRPRRADEPVNA